jgi:intracellular septation protein
MAGRTLNPFVKLVLEIGPIAVFFLAYRMAPVAAGLADAERQLEQILFATAVFVPTILGALAVSFFLTRTLPRMAVITAVVVTVFGGLTMILRDDTFVKMKPTILYCLFAGILGFGLLRGQSYLRYLMDELIPMQQEGWMIFTRRFVVFYLVLAVLNEVVWRQLGTDTWVNFRTFVLPLANILFILAQVPLFQRYAEKEQTPSS